MAADSRNQAFNAGVKWHRGFPGGGQDVKKAIDLLMSVVDVNIHPPHPAAEYELSLCFLQVRDEISAIDYMKRAAAHGFADAKFLLAERHMRGMGVEIDYDKARELCREAIALGHMGARTRLGLLLLGDKETHAEAVALFTEAAKIGDTTAIRSLAECYNMGMGVPQDFSKAIYWYQKCDLENDADLMYNYGTALEMRCQRDDQVLSRQLFVKAVELGHWNAQMVLAVDLLAAGKVAEAIPLFKKSAVQNNICASYQLAVCYEDGCPPELEMDKAEAKVWRDLVSTQAAIDQKPLALALAMIEGIIKRADGSKHDSFIREGVRSLCEMMSVPGGCEIAKTALAKYTNIPVVAQVCCMPCGKFQQVVDGKTHVGAQYARLYRCKGCGIAQFCSNRCQVKGWSVHKAHCKIWCPAAVAKRRALSLSSEPV